jgi:hypothetical protein
MYFFLSEEKRDKFIENYVFDSKRNWALYKIVAAWEKLDCKRLSWVITDDVVLYDATSTLCKGAQEVLKYHQMWFERIKESIKKNPSAIFATPANMRDNDDFDLYVDDRGHLSENLFAFLLTFRENKIAGIGIYNNEFLRIADKYDTTSKKNNNNVK